MENKCKPWNCGHNGTAKRVEALEGRRRMKQSRDAKLSFVKRESIALSKRLMDLKINKCDQ